MALEDLFKRRPPPAAAPVAEPEAPPPPPPPPVLALPAPPSRPGVPIGNVFRGTEPARQPREAIERPRGLEPRTGAGASAAAEFWRRAGAMGAASDDDRHPYRVVVAWRFARQILRLSGESDGTGEALEQIFGTSDAWECAAFTSAPLLGKSSSSSAILMYASGRNRMSGEPENPPCVGVRPPMIPDRYVDAAAGVVLPEYDPGNPVDDPMLGRWMRVFKLVCDFLGIINGTGKDREFGRYALEGLTDPWRVRSLWPSREEIELLDAVVISDALKVFVDKGAEVCAKWLRDEYGLCAIETKEVLASARRSLVDFHTLTTDEAKAVITARLERLMEKAEQAEDNRTKLSALKLLSVVHGVGRAEPVDGNRTFFETAKRAALNPQPGHAVIEMKPEDFEVN